MIREISINSEKSLSKQTELLKKILKMYHESESKDTKYEKLENEITDIKHTLKSIESILKHLPSKKTES